MHYCVKSIISIIICISINCAGIERCHHSDRCVVTIGILVAAGSVLFGFIQACQAYAPQIAEYLHNA